MIVAAVSESGESVEVVTYTSFDDDVESLVHSTDADVVELAEADVIVGAAHALGSATDKLSILGLL